MADDIDTKFNFTSDPPLMMEYEELRALITKCQSVFQHEKTLIRIGHPIIVVGDLHGQYKDLQRILSLPFSNAANAHGVQRFLFLGDYVDRGKEAVPLLITLMRLKVNYRRSYFMLRGNHESDMVNRTYGFYDEVMNRFPDGVEGLRLYVAFNEMFSWLPLSALISGRILCMHGGISPKLTSLKDIENIKRPLPNPMRVELAMDLLWADPVIHEQNFQKNALRKVSVFFNDAAVIEVCERLDLDLIIRAHQVMYNGYWFFANEKLLTIFSAPCYSNDNKGTVVVIGERKTLGFVFLTPVKEEQSKESFECKFEYFNRMQNTENAEFMDDLEAKSGDTVLPLELLVGAENKKKEPDEQEENVKKEDSYFKKPELFKGYDEGKEDADKKDDDDKKDEDEKKDDDGKKNSEKSKKEKHDEEKKEKDDKKEKDEKKEKDDKKDKEGKKEKEEIVESYAL